MEDLNKMESVAISKIPAEIPPFDLPEDIPQVLPEQKFQLGNEVRWTNIPNPDFGRILGVIYTESASCLVTGLHYLILLDPRSPSRYITAYDFAFEEDIERIE